MNQQATFTKIKTHLLKQNKVASGSGGCMYRTLEGLKCAIGCLIPDEIYVPGMESCSISSLQRACPELIKIFDIQQDDDFQFLKDAQKVHDYYYPEAWPGELTLLAEKYDLEDEVANEKE